MNTKRMLKYIRNYSSRNVKKAAFIRLEDEKIHTILIPRVIAFKEKQKADNWLPAGAKLEANQEVGLNLFLNVINFCYQDPDNGCEYTYTNSSGKPIKRATGLITAMVESGIDWNNLVSVVGISSDTWKQILQLSETNTLYLGEERGLRIRGMAGWLISRGCATVEDFLESCNYDALSVIHELEKSGYFQDEFLKRAQLAARMMSDVLLRRTGKSLSNMEHLTVMADYRIPQVFYNLGVVTITDSNLLQKLNDHTIIDPGSGEEIELRSTAVYIGSVLAEAMNITEAEVDNLLWGLSQEMVRSGEMKIPHMLVATDAY